MKREVESVSVWYMQGTYWSWFITLLRGGLSVWSSVSWERGNVHGYMGASLDCLSRSETWSWRIGEFGLETHAKFSITSCVIQLRTVKRKHSAPNLFFYGWCNHCSLWDLTAQVENWFRNKKVYDTMWDLICIFWALLAWTNNIPVISYFLFFYFLFWDTREQRWEI